MAVDDTHQPREPLQSWKLNAPATSPLSPRMLMRYNFSHSFQYSYLKKRSISISPYLKVTLEFRPLNSTWLWSGVGCFCVKYLPCRESLRCMLEVILEICPKNILHWFIEGTQTHCGMSRGAKMSLAPKWTAIGCFLLKFKHRLRGCTITTGKKVLIFHAKQPIGKS